MRRILIDFLAPQFQSQGAVIREFGSTSGGTEFLHGFSPFRNLRLLNEIMMLAPGFTRTGGLYYDESNLDWIIVPNFPLPDKWVQSTCDVLIVPPTTYPSTPPIGFYVNQEIRFKDGGRDPHAIGYGAHDAPDLSIAGWRWYCVTVQKGAGGWHPSADFAQPDNLLTYLNMVRESLTNDF